MAEAINLLVHRRVFFDIGIGARNIGFGLVIVVIGDKILDRIIWEKGFHLSIKLSRQSFVMCQDKGRALQIFDDLGHGEGFTRTGNAQQNLVFFKSLYAANQFLNSLRLIACRFKF